MEKYKKPTKLNRPGLKLQTAYLPPLPGHLEKFLCPVSSVYVHYLDFIKTVKELHPKWEANELIEDDDLCRFLEAMNGLIIVAREQGAVAQEARRFLLDLLDRQTVKTAKHFVLTGC